MPFLFPDVYKRQLSCDREVVRDTGSDTRLSYTETIIGAVRYQSRRKTTLSTHFYGGKTSMKDPIYSIMDTRKKKAGAVVICGALMLTLGTVSYTPIDVYKRQG